MEFVICNLYNLRNLSSVPIGNWADIVGSETATIMRTAAWQSEKHNGGVEGNPQYDTGGAIS